MTFKEALVGPDQDGWCMAMDNEMNSLRENDTWEFVKPQGKTRALPCKWVYKRKMNPDGSMCYKARLVIKDYSQKEGIDYDKTFSPVAKLSTIRVLLSVAVCDEGLSLRQFDVATAFLNGKLKEELYMKQPEGYNNGTGRLCKLKKSLYALKQAPRCWNSCIHDFLIESGFKQTEADPCLYFRKRGNGKILLGLYVDDGLIASTDEAEAEHFLEQELKARFKITTRPASYFLGLELERQADCAILVFQRAYIKQILDKFGMTGCKPVATPAVKESRENVFYESTKTDGPDFPYRQEVGALSY